VPLESDGGGVELMAPFGLGPSAAGGGVLESGGRVVVVPGEAVESLAGAAVELSAGEFAAPPGEVDSCFEQAPRSASEPTHINTTLRFMVHLTVLRVGCSLRRSFLREAGGPTGK
jgi:hypothetical protein